MAFFNIEMYFKHNVLININSIALIFLPYVQVQLPDPSNNFEDEGRFIIIGVTSSYFRLRHFL